MRKTVTKRKRVVGAALALLMIFSMISFPTFKVKAAGTVDDFVERCYLVTLGRGSDPDGFADWKGQLLNGKAVGIEIAYGFLFSPEYTKKNKSNEDYVTDLYMLFMGREPDEGGFNDWVGQLDAGKSRLEVFAGFANSQEFYNICDSYGITAGRFVSGYDRATINNVNLFVERLYKTCLGRIGDKDGQKNWVEQLIKKQITGSECARRFIFSQEYTNKGLSDEEFVENLYLAMMGRSSDAEGKTNWLNALTNGKTRDEVFAGFVNSVEFANICATYKIDKGSYSAKDIGTQQQNKKYRAVRKESSNGDYVVIEYKYGGDYSSRESKYDKNGNFIDFEKYDEYNEDHSERKQYGKLESGNATKYAHTKSIQNEEGEVVKEYQYSDEWNTVESYSIYENEKITDSSTGKELTRLKRLTVYNKNNEIVSICDYEYNANNLLSKKTQKDLYKIMKSEMYEYFDNGGIEKETSIIYSSDGTEFMKNVFEYAENGNIIKELSYFEGQYTGSGIYEYDGKGNIIKYTKNTKDDKVVTSRIYERDSQGKILTDIEYNSDGEIIVRVSYTYDSKGNVLNKKSEGWGSITEWLYEYDEKGNQIKMSEKSNGNVVSWETTKYEEY